MSREVSDNETPLQEASRLIRALAEPCPAGDSKKAALSRAHRKLPGWTANRVRDVWSADPRISISAGEINELRSVDGPRIEVGEDILLEFQSVLESFNVLTAFMERLARTNSVLDNQKSARNGSLPCGAHRAVGS